MWGWICCAVILALYISSSRHMANRAESLTEYIEFLLMHPDVYNDHRQKYLGLLQTINEQHKDPIKVKFVAANSVSDIAARLYDRAMIANVVLRVRGGQKP